MYKLVCFICDKKYVGIKNFTSHFRKSHAIMVSKAQISDFYCKQVGCNKHFLRYSSFLRHLQKYHVTKNNPGVFHNDNTPKSENPRVFNDDNTPESENWPQIQNWTENIVNAGENVSLQNESTESVVPLDISSSALEMVASLRATSSFTGAAISRVVNATSALVSDISEFVRREVISVFKNKGIDPNDPELESLLEKVNFDHLFDNMDTVEGQMNALKTHYNYIEPTEIPLDYRNEKRLNTTTQTWEQKQVYETFQYVSIIDTITLITSHEDIWNHINSESSALDDYLCSFRDGVSFKNNIFFQQHPNALRIQLYYDDIVVNNPLGSKVQSHKIGAFYFLIQNLPSHLNSFLGGIHVLALCHTANIEKYGIGAMLKPFIHDLKRLESDEGVVVSKNGKERILRASLAAVCADGLATHQIFGFMSPSARLFCRLCLIDRVEFHANPSRLCATPRTRQVHDRHIKAIKSKVTQKDIKNAQKKCGIKEESPLHSSRYFHCTENFIFDGMHDIFEGVAPMEIKLVLNQFVTDKDYDSEIDTLNARLNLFTYGVPEVKNKPSANFTVASLSNIKDHKLKQTAAQTWCLMRVLPFIVSDKVPKDNEYLSLLLLLNRITEIVFATKLRVSILPYFSELILEHDALFRKLFPDIDPINKLHHLLHYPECIRRSGPLRWLNCFRFEAKHSMLKKQGSVCCNYKNITKTMINHCQISQCQIWGSGEKPREKLKYTKSETLKIEQTLSKFQLYEKGLKNNDIAVKVSKIEIYGVDYRTQLFVAIDSGTSNDHGYPVFGRIKEILILKNGQVYLWCEEWSCMWLSEELNAYCVAPNSTYTLINPDDLCDLKPFSLWSDYRTSYCYIVLRHLLL